MVVATALAVSEQGTRDAILNAAERRFADYGFAGSSVREIASDVGLKNQASLYHYFPHKKALYETVLRRRVDALLPLWQGAGERIGASTNAGERAASVAAGLDRVLDYLTEHPDTARLIARAGLDDHTYVRSAVPRRRASSAAMSPSCRPGRSIRRRSPRPRPCCALSRG